MKTAIEYYEEHRDGLFSDRSEIVSDVISDMLGEIFFDLNRDFLKLEDENGHIIDLIIQTIKYNDVWIDICHLHKQNNGIIPIPENLFSANIRKLLEKVLNSDSENGVSFYF